MKSKRVLIVDDNDLNRKLFENLIGQLFSFESAKNGLEAVAFTQSGNFDLILMDIQMPIMDGITAMKKIKQGGYSTCPILAVTAYAEESDRISFLEQGFDDFILKPIRPKEFLQLIQAYLLNPGERKISTEVPGSEHSILDPTILGQLLKYNSKSAIKKVFDDFLLECDEAEAMINLRLPNSVPTDLIKKIHMLKGNSGTLGAMGIYHSCKKAEEFERSANLPEFEEEMKKLKNEIRQFRDFLNQEPNFEA